MRTKKKRVTKELFLSIMKQGKSISSSLFVFRYTAQKDLQYAFVAPKTVAKKAVDRNRLRRQGYAALHSYPLSSGAGIFFYKKEVKTATFQAIKKEIGSILEKAHSI